MGAVETTVNVHYIRSASRRGGASTMSLSLPMVLRSMTVQELNVYNYTCMHVFMHGYY